MFAVLIFATLPGLIALIKLYVFLEKRQTSKLVPLGSNEEHVLTVPAQQNSWFESISKCHSWWKFLFQDSFNPALCDALHEYMYEKIRDKVVEHAMPQVKDRIAWSNPTKILPQLRVSI